MKKTLIALAALGAIAGAHAQSSVTLYGVADAWLGSVKTETAGVGTRQTVINTSGVNGSRWGLKGSEDLGGGMKAIFQLESGFKLDTGEPKTAGVLFDRQAYVGLQSGFGTVSLGRQYSAYDDLHGAVNHNFDAFTFSATSPVAGNGLVDYTSRVSNSIKFQSVNYSGFSAAVLYGLGENKTATADATNIGSLNLTYANGPLMVGYAYQEEKQPLVAGTQDKNKYNLFGGTYDFGVVKLNASYNQAKNSVTKDKEYQVGVMVPFGAAAISAGYAHSKSDTGAVSLTGKGFSLLGTYDLSKRTRLYAGAQETKVFSGVLATTPETKVTTYGLGVRHSF